jgi:hypothetical protein
MRKKVRFNCLLKGAAARSSFDFLYGLRKKGLDAQKRLEEREKGIEKGSRCPNAVGKEGYGNREGSSIPISGYKRVKRESRYPRLIV